MDNGVLSTYELQGSFSGHRLYIEGYGYIDDIDGIEIGHGCLVSARYKNYPHVSYIFIADKPVIKTNSTTEEQYLLHKGVFSDERAEGRCWFVDKTNEVDGIIYTTYGGMFHVKHSLKGVMV